MLALETWCCLIDTSLTCTTSEWPRPMCTGANVSQITSSSGTVQSPLMICSGSLILKMLSVCVSQTTSGNMSSIEQVSSGSKRSWVNPSSSSGSSIPHTTHWFRTVCKPKAHYTSVTQGFILRSNRMNFESEHFKNNKERNL